MANQPQLSALLSSYLERQADAQGQGLGTRDLPGEVVPHEAGPVQAVDSRLAWEEGLTAAALLLPEEQAASWKVPACWPTLVAGLEPAVALAFSLGNFPQLVRDLHSLLQNRNPAQLPPPGTRTYEAAGLSEWAEEIARKKQFPQRLLAAALLRMAREFEQAGQLLQLSEAEIPSKMRPAWANEQAALLWHQGKYTQARALWKDQAESVPVLFNRGMSALFLGDTVDARVHLTSAVAQLPEDGAWHHLGRLYLALTELNG